MEFKLNNTLYKLYLKFTDRDAYKIFKHSLYDKKFEEKAVNLSHVNLDHPYKKITHFKHSGNSGDIMYSLPVIFALCKNGAAHLHLNANQRGQYTHFHPLGNIMLTNKMIDMLKPLLLYQPKIASCDVFDDQQIDYDLDIFRKQIFHLNKGSIIRWYFHVFGVYYNTSLPWLVAPRNDDFSAYIVIARSHRYRSPGVSYAFLKKYKKIAFLGLPIEFEDIKKDIPEIEHYPVKDFLEMAAVINSCRLFIGNQTFAFSIAEGLKVNRLLELYYEAPNVVVEGSGAHDFYYQPHFKKAVDMLYNI